MTLSRVDMTRDGIMKSLVSFALPFLVSSLFQELYNTVDTAIVSRFLGDEALAAMGACSAVYELLVGFAMGVCGGMGLVISRYCGADSERMLRRSVAGSAILLMSFTAIITLLSMVFLRPLLILLETPEEILGQSLNYITIIMAGAVITMAYNLLACLLRSIGDSFMPLVFLVAASVINVLLDVLLIVVLGMGVGGAAVATVIAQGIAALLCVRYIFRRCRRLIPRPEDFRPEKALYRELAAQGFAMGLANALVSVGSVILQRAINQLGTRVIAGHTLARKLNNFLIMPVDTVSVAVSTFVSLNYGADNRERIRKSLRVGMGMSLVWGALATALMGLFAPALVKLVSGSEDALVLGNAARYLRINGPFYAVLGILFISRLSLQGLGKTTVPILSSVVELLAKVVFSFLLIPSMGYMGAILCEPVSWCLMTALLLPTLMMHPYLRGKEKVLQKDA